MTHTEALEAGIRLAAAGYTVTIALKREDVRRLDRPARGEVTIHPGTDKLDELVAMRAKAREVLGDRFDVEQDQPGWLEVTIR